MPENGFDKELIASNLLGANTLQELYEKEKILTNAKMIMLKENPFREGNGRVQRIFMQYLAENAGYTLNFQDISEDEMTKASITSASGNLTLMRNIFTKTILV